MSRSDVLVSANWVEANAENPHVVVVGVDDDPSLFDAGHIAGAVSLDWKRDLQHPVRRDFVDRAGFEALMSAHGISPDDTVVLYGNSNNWFAGYAYWYFKTYGHRDVRLLDGGQKKWELESRPLTTSVLARPATTYLANDPDASIRAMHHEVVAAIGTAQIVDARSPGEYSGRLLAPAHLPQEQPQRAGHIPSAINVPWSQATNDDGTFKTNDELAVVYGRLDPARPTIVYCRVGERSAHTWFVLHELLGFVDVRNYDGSWTEYGAMVGVPIEVGDDSVALEGAA